jgi:hypothetical protein
MNLVGEPVGDRSGQCMIEIRFDSSRLKAWPAPAYMCSSAGRLAARNCSYKVRAGVASVVERTGGYEGRRCVLDVICRNAERTGKHQDLEVRPVSIGLRDPSVTFSRRHIVSDQRDELASRRKTHDPDTMRVDSIFGGMRSNPPDRAPDVGYLIIDRHR